MAYSFGSLGFGSVDIRKLPLSMGQSYPKGDTRNLDVYDDGVLRAARATTSARSAQNTARDVSMQNYSFGSNIGTTGVAPSVPLSFPASVPKGRNPLTSLGSFFSNMTFGQPVNSAGPTAQTSPGWGTSPVQPIPQVNTANGDGSTGSLTGLANLAQSIFANMGNSGDGDVVPVAYSPQAEASGGINPLWIAAAAVGAGVIYYAAAK
ncbi:hypothetical protein PhaeoP83_01736 [Phaeobacter inhibens]|uniref:hypothetical protein n=1 Tax=Phaeobacter inhibens TaxID=221822 RepID=UPI000C9CD7EF|nr:hypothetical protein [Phaeobacter inhibens]AUQ50009.1 hypothetical protein PhaeoP83_01736 [Phaeobacter inhibens]AUQ54263.1 hypothetical protein PhaeoP92_01582 [Phaeobacter inhibens]AUQ78279.1 hypothetical protein PhaeoP74_01583 [Phaeobacter inhibens]AUR15438.1 hypothetical protein PhaeoP70_01581 [Phaeobacter inhibens]AUR19814.1 hypothetical protein PhaeoP80_01736 [Phaeobacter inhibens]